MHTKIELKDIVTQETDAWIGGKCYTLRRFDLGDEAWLHETFGDKKGELFTEKMTTNQMAQLAFNQLKDEDKADFKKVKAKVINDEGDELEIEIGGWKLLRQKVSGTQEKAALMKALVHTLGIAQPLWDKIVKNEGNAAEKAKLLELKKKQKMTGRRSLTASLTNINTRSKR